MFSTVIALDDFLLGVAALEAVALVWTMVRIHRTRRRLRSVKEAVVRLSRDVLRARGATGRWEVLEELRARGRAPRLPVAFRSQNGEDLLLWEIFRDQADGYYVEAGAYDGVSFSVSYVFEALGWTGLLVEPLPDRARECATNRPRSRVVAAALSRPGRSGEITLRAARGKPGVDMLSTVGESVSERERVQREGGTFAPVRVRLTTLEGALAEAGAPKTVDFAVLDVEGHEIQVLEGIDWAKHSPRVLLVEDNSNGRDRLVASFLAQRGYVSAGPYGGSEVFIRETEPELLRRAKAWLA